MDASINVEVFSGTSDRFGGKIAAVMYRLSSPEVGRWSESVRGRRCSGRCTPMYLTGRCRATGPSLQQPAAGRGLSAGERSFWESEQWECRPGWSAGGTWRTALDWASGAA